MAMESSGQGTLLIELAGGASSSDDEFSSPLSSPNSKFPQVKLGAVIGLSNATAIGTFDNISTEQQRLSVTESQAIEGMLTFEESEPKKVKFKEDDKMISHFDDTDLWAHDPNETAQDMINAYQRECMIMRIKPIQILLDQLKGVYDLTTPIDTIDLTGVKLENKTCEVLEAILSRVHASTLKLERTNLEDEGIIAICEMVEFYGCACKLLLAHNNRLRPRAWLTIGRTLKKSPFLDTIDVSYCALDEQTLTLLLRAVRANCGLKSLKMEGNNLTGKGTFILMAAMKFNENLQELYLSRNHLGPEDGQHLGNILRSNHTLRVLDVSDNNLQDSGTRYISAGIAEQQEGLVILNISTNNLTHDGIHHISAMLPCTRSLRELNISNNRFGDNGLFMLKLGILANRSVEKLVLSSTRITSEGAVALAEILAESRYLTHVDLRENEIGIAGLMGLCLALRMNHKILHLETPKTFKVEQRDRQLIREKLAEIEEHRARNHREKEERDKEESRRIHEATHAQATSGSVPDALLSTTGTGVGVATAVDDDDKKEVDPSLVGSLDNVYTEETEAAMNSEDDPFMTVVTDSSIATPAEMEKTVNALVIYSSEHEECPASPLADEDNCQTDEYQFRRENELDLLTTNTATSNSSSQEILPDILTTPNTAATSTDDTSTVSSRPPPDIAPTYGTLPPDLAAVSPLDLLNPTDNAVSNTAASNPLDLTRDVPN